MALQLSVSIPAFPSEDRRDAMKTTCKWTLSAGLVLASGLTGLCQTAKADSSETSPAVTIHVRNYAGVAPRTLAEAEEVAAGIFRNAGVETRWVDDVLIAETVLVNPANHPADSLADIQLSILPQEMSDRLGFPKNVMGLVPGTDAQVAYVFESKVNTLFNSALNALCHGRLDRQVSRSVILGHAIAHELGHLLLDLKGHTTQGIMRAEWGLKDLWDAAHRFLLFTPQQAEVMRADVRRRNAPRATFTAAVLESPALAR
jgi:hypothetical protein